MIGFDEAVREVLHHVPRGRVARVRCDDALGLSLARAIKARFRLPRTDQSAMDGIAVHCDDVAGASPASPVVLRHAGEIPAGSNRRPRLRRGEAIQVFTGSAVPEGTEAVVMVEYCRFEGQEIEVCRSAAPGAHLRRAGEEMRRGDVVLDPHTVVTPPVVGILALFGIEEIFVFGPPRVSVITMGDEIVPSGARRSPVQIHDANGPALAAALRAMGVDDVRVRLVGDRPERLVRALGNAIEVSDVVITVGGASVGDHDHVREARHEVGVREIFDRVAMKPGKPNLFGLAGRVPVFSLPGNPVSALVSFQHFVRPALHRMMGRPVLADPTAGWARLERAYHKKPGRREWVRGVLQFEEGAASVSTDLAQGSHMLSGLARADVLVDLAESASELTANAPVPFRRLDWWERG